MEDRYMGYKKKFRGYDFLCYLGIIIFLVAFLEYTGSVLVSLIYLFIINPIFNTNYSSLPIAADLIAAGIYLAILIVLRKYFYYEIVKYNMQKGCSFVINPNGIALLVKKGEPVVISTNEIDCINMRTYISPLKNIYRAIWRRLWLFTADSNFCKDMIIIEVRLKSHIDLNKFERRGLFYKWFNCKTDRRTNQVKFCLYEIIYNTSYQEDMVVFHQYFGNLIQTDLEY